MHAELSPTCVTRSILLGIACFAIVSLSGCKTEKGPDDPTVLGQPTADAYLGVEYYYNFGAYGGEGILDYSLSKAPSWLALEDTSNKARQGIIIRGVPGLTGGNRGRGDLGKTENITLLTTDGQGVGLQPFDVEVNENVLSLSARDFREGAFSDQPAGTEREDVCEAPDLGAQEDEEADPQTGEHQYLTEVYNDDGSVAELALKTKETTPVLVRVLLDQPSVTTVKVAFELVSDFDVTECDDSIAPPHQRCSHSVQNRDRAVGGQDIVALGSHSAARLPVPDYLEYLADDNGDFTKGVITLKPGITECYIRLEVVDDDIPEASQFVRVELSDVRQGLAALGAGNSVVRQTLQIDDNETAVSFETAAGSIRDVINSEETRDYNARLTDRKDENATYRVKLHAADEATAVPDDDYHLEGVNPEYPDTSAVEWIPVDELEFPPGQTKVPFRVVASNESVIPIANDKVIVVAVDERYQDGRDNYVAPANAGLRISINEFVSPFYFSRAVGFVPTDITVGANGQIIVVGIDAEPGANVAEGPVQMIVLDRKGQLVATYQVSAAIGTEDAPPVVRYSERSVEIDKNTVIRREVAVAYGTTGAIAGATNAGGLDGVQALYRYDADADAYAQIWQYQSGTSGNDKPKAVALGRSGNLFVGGETDGSWPENTSAGDIDTYVQRIDTELKDDAELPVLAWTRQVGSAFRDRVYSLDSQNTGALLIGGSTGAVDGQPQLGGTDYFFYNAFSAKGIITVRQRGTDQDDLVTGALLEGGQIWLSILPGEYQRFETLGQNTIISTELRSQRLNSVASSIINYSAPDILTGALTLNDENDAAQDELTSMILFDSDVVGGGRTDGRFDPAAEATSPSGTPILARVARLARDDEAVSNDEEEEVSDEPVLAPGLEDIWRVQPARENAKVDALAQYRDDKIISLIRQDGASGSSTFWHLVLFSGEGRRLNPYTVEVP